MRHRFAATGVAVPSPSIPPMRIVLLLLVLLTQLPAAAFNPRVSDREVALNDPVRIVFTTTKPQLEDVDVEATVKGALAAKSVRDNWRVAEVEITQHEKAKDVRVEIRLAPRISGDLALPAIPVLWMEGELSVEFGSVSVSERIRVGTDYRPAPDDLLQVAGFRWGAALDKIAAKLPNHAVETDQNDAATIKVRPGLTLHFTGGRLAAAELLAAGLSLAEAKASFIERWGNISEEPEDGLLWHLGWLTIKAMDSSDGIILHLAHQGIRADAVDEQVRRDVFAILDAEVATVEPAVDGAAPADAAEEAAPASQSQSGLGNKDYEAAFEHVLKKQDEAAEAAE